MVADLERVAVLALNLFRHVPRAKVPLVLERLAARHTAATVSSEMSDAV
jgi:hypothetical protein